MRRSVHLLPLLLVVALALACSGKGDRTVPTPPTAPTPPSPPTPPPSPPPPPNNPPLVTLHADFDRVEMDRELTFAAAVSDAETPIDNLIYEWSATAGAINGSGRTVKWRAPIIDASPARHTVTLKVKENYTGPDGPTQHVIERSLAVTVNNSQKELKDLAGGFIADFADSANSPEFCVRNFTDTCGAGKRAELRDIAENRRLYVINSATWEITRVTITGIDAEVIIRCRFTSTTRATGVVGTAVGDAIITAKYEKDRWYLCESRWRPVNALAVGFLK